MSAHAAHSGPWPRAVLFDLDGTLVDSAADIAGAVNEVLEAAGLTRHPLPAVRRMIGHGVGKLVERAFAAHGRPLSGAALDEQIAAMMDVYGNHLTNLTTLSPGAADAVRQARASGAKVAVVTNKPEGFTRTILDHFGLSDMVDAVVGGDTGPTKKPAPDMLLHALGLLGVPAAGALMVGDSAADVDSARAAGVPVIAVRGGYTDVPTDELGADGVIDSLEVLEQAVAMLVEHSPA